MILIITNKEDVTSDFIINKLNALSLPYYRFNTEDFISNIGLNIDFSKNQYKIFDNIKNIEINLNDVQSVYYRRPKLPVLKLSSKIKKSEFEFALNEVLTSLDGLYKLLSDKLWISPIDSIRYAENKIYQQFIAKQLGFNITKGIITTEKNYAESFLHEEHSSFIVKPVKTGFINDEFEPKVIYTSEFTDNNFDKLNRLKFCPTYFQHKIDKLADLRVTIVGERFFAAKINSQDFEDTTTDWRKGEKVELKYERFELNQDLKEKCLKLLKFYNLNFGAIDFVIDKNKDLIFLEINPNGQWAWIEKRLNYDISGAIVDLLLKGRSFL